MSEPRRHRWPLVTGVTFTAAVFATSAWSGAATAAAPAEGVIQGAAVPGAVADSYVVVLKDVATSAGDPITVARALTTRHGGSVGLVYRTALRGFSLKASVEDAKQIAADPAVASVSQDAVVKATAAPDIGPMGGQVNPPSWGLDRIDQRSLPLDQKYVYPSLASTVTAYVIDTGIRTTHADFGGRASWGVNETDDGQNTDCNGHGTHVAGTIGGSKYGVAKKVHLTAVKVLTCEGWGFYSWVIAGVDWVSANAVGKVAVANMSLGGGGFDPLDQAVKNSVAKGVVYALAAGNGSGDAACDYSPARVGPAEGAITVAAVNKTDNRASFSSIGSCVDIFAPGQDIVSTWNSSDAAVATLSGTSMATPHVTGAAAMVRAAHPTFAPAKVEKVIKSNGLVGKVINPGVGSPNLLLYVGMYGPYTNGTVTTIPDDGPFVVSPVTVAGLSSTASPHSKVYVDITHPSRGDLVIYLRAPDGELYLLKAANPVDSSPNVKTTYTVDLSSEAKNGTWNLMVRDVSVSDAGVLDNWRLWL